MRKMLQFESCMTFKSLKQLKVTVTSTLPDALQKVWISWVLCQTPKNHMPMSKQMWHPRNPHCSMAARPEHRCKSQAMVAFQNKYKKSRERHKQQKYTVHYMIDSRVSDMAYAACVSCFINLGFIILNYHMNLLHCQYFSFFNPCAIVLGLPIARHLVLRLLRPCKFISSIISWHHRHCIENFRA